MKTRSGLGLAVTGALLIATTYGMARFGVGLFAPRLVAERPALATVVGGASGAQFASYAVAALVAMRFADRRPRLGLLAAGLTATAGCVGVAAATSPGWFVLAVFVGGMGAGFASPAMVRVVDSSVSRGARSTAQSLVNAGTAVGVVVTGLVALAVGPLGPAWLLMAASVALSATLLLALARRDTTAPSDPEAVPDETVSPRTLVPPVVGALVAGLGSALIWTYGPLLATELGSLGGDRVGTMWIALGVGGLVGPLTGVVVDRRGLGAAWRLFAGVLALANLVLALALASGSAWSTYAAMVLFGAGYMCLSGTLVLWARAVAPASAGAATSVLFVALAVGQAVGAVAFGPVREVVGPVAATLLAAGACALGAAVARAPALSTPRR